MSFRDLIVRAVPLERKPAPPMKVKAPAAPRSKPSRGGWGTPEERYRRLCLLAQLCRYAYYVKHVSLIPDTSYDELERAILRIESANRDIMDHHHSPTARPGSDRAETYPRSVLSLWHFCGDDSRTWQYMEAVVAKAITFATEAFSVVSP